MVDKSRLRLYQADPNDLANSIWNPILNLGQDRIGKMIVISMGVWNAIIHDPAVIALLDPISEYNLVLDGRLGTIFGMDLGTDAYQIPELHFLSGMEFILVDGLDEFHKLVPKHTDKEVLELASKADVNRAKVLDDIFNIIHKETRSGSEER